ncbi:MAG: uridine phosphorylase [Deltaproteobacteria bacterium]|nr:uridine phosphorylase [Deltaproteobacteria bacterium]
MTEKKKKKNADELQYHIHLKPGDVGRYVILPGDPGRVEKIASFFDEAEEVAFNREYRTYTGQVDGIRLSCTSTGIGCPSTAIAVEELVAIGADTFIRVGTSGAVQRHVDVGHLCITTAAVREEGTSHQYVPPSYPAVADLDVTWALREAARRLGFTHHTGIGHCKDAFFIEGEHGIPIAEQNEALWNAWRRARVISTSMESAALFVVSSIRGSRAGEVLATIGLTWLDDPIVAKVGIDDAIRTAIEAIKILDGLER